MDTGFEFLADTEGVMTLSFTAPINETTFNSLLSRLPDRMAAGEVMLLVDPAGQRVQASLSAVITYGQALGQALLMRGTKVALVRSGQQVEEDIFAAQIYNSGVSLAQFESQSEARAWLIGGLQ